VESDEIPGKWRANQVTMFQVLTFSNNKGNWTEPQAMASFRLGMLCSYLPWSSS